MNMELGKVYVVDDGEYKPIGHARDVEITMDEINRIPVIKEPIGGEFHLTVYLDNNHRKLHGLPLRRGCVNKRFKESIKLLSRWIYI